MVRLLPLMLCMTTLRCLATALGSTPSPTVSVDLNQWVTESVPETLELENGLERRATSPQRLSDGNTMVSGPLSPTLRWQSSGILTRFKCPSFKGTLQIKSCYELFLSRRGMLQPMDSPTTTSTARTTAKVKTAAARLDQTSLQDLAAQDDDDLDLYFRAFPDQAQDRWLAPRNVEGPLERRQLNKCVTPPPTTTSGGGGGPSPVPSVPAQRQRMEIMTWPGARPNERWTYNWRTYQALHSTTSYNFFHAWQILRRDGCGGAVITLDYAHNLTTIHDQVRGCRYCTSVPFSHWMGKTIQHQMTIRYGLQGSISYTAFNANNKREVLLTYSAKGDMGSSASLKMGQYRAVFNGMRDTTSWWGQFSAVKG